MALIWEGDGLAAHELADLGLPKGSEGAGPPSADRRFCVGARADATDVQRRAGKIAADLGHSYVGTEHQLQAVIDDVSLADAILAAQIRGRARQHVANLITTTSSER